MNEEKVLNYDERLHQKVKRKQNRNYQEHSKSQELDHIGRSKASKKGKQRIKNYLDYTQDEDEDYNY